MPVSFGAFLDLKFALDERSLNPTVRAAFHAALRDRPALACLDLGVGSGASLVRLLAAEPAADLKITAVDRDPTLLKKAQERTETLLRKQEFRVSGSPGVLWAKRGERRVAVEFVAADLRNFEPDRPGACDAVIAHAVMDLLPPGILAGRIGGWLKPGGLCYASLNYDGGTSLFPEYPNPALEERILAAYDASMERRRVWDQASGGARSGRRLHGALLQAGLDILVYGSSDWNLVPSRRAYRAGEAAFLAEILGLIRGEAERSGEFGGRDLEAWHRERLARIEAGELGLIVHQIDLLAEKPEPVTA
jgi:SAM-dependent methyltransferase